MVSNEWLICFSPEAGSDHTGAVRRGMPYSVLKLVYMAEVTLARLRGMASKRAGSRYASGRTDVWRKMKNPEAPAVRRVLE